MIISIINEKGGSGKTTLSVNLSIKFSQIGDEVLLLDADPQQSTKVFVDIRKQESKKVLFDSLYSKGENVKKTLEKNQKYDTIIVDTGGRDSIEMRQAIAFSDIVIIPTIPSQYDASVLQRMIDVFIQAKNINPELRGLIVINKAPTNPFLMSRINDLRNFIKQNKVQDLDLMDSVLYERVALMNATSDGIGITELEGCKAKEDFEAFFAELSKKTIK